MNEQTAFQLIDKGIAILSADRDFIVSNDNHSDWLVFDIRQLIWQEDFNYSIGIFPNFEKELITSWNLSASAWFDDKNFRYFLGRDILKEVPLKYVAENIVESLEDAFQYLDTIKKGDIPREVDFDNPTAL